jgi:beta-glucosidase
MGLYGVVITDWASIREMITWGYAKDGAEASERAVTAGADMDMESYLYVNQL